MRATPLTCDGSLGQEAGLNEKERRVREKGNRDGGRQIKVTFRAVGSGLRR